MKTKDGYLCSACGHTSAKWYGKCPNCSQYNTMKETKITVGNVTSKSPNKSTIIAKSENAKKLNDVQIDKAHRINTGLSELNRVLGGGLVAGSIVLLGGDPGIGKSTLLLQICNALANEGTVLYASGEESSSQIKLRAERIGKFSDNVWLYSESDLQKIEAEVTNLKPKVLIVDSVQTIYRQEIDAVAGTVSQVREVTSSLTFLAKKTGTTVLVIGHVTKGGDIAGPKILEHLVDTVLYFEGDKYESYRILRAEKNRFGSTNEIGVFEMRNNGFEEVTNPSGLFISEENKDEPGCCVSCAVEGTRPLLVELQALVSPTAFGNPRRMTTGIDTNRLNMLAAVIEKKANLRFGDQDIYLNVVGGFKITERATDFAVAMAIISALKNNPIGKETAFIGEISLTGEIRPVSYIEKRVRECKNMGFKYVMIPKGSAEPFKGDTSIIPISNISEAIKISCPSV